MKTFRTRQSSSCDGLLGSLPSFPSHSRSSVSPWEREVSRLPQSKRSRSSEPSCSPLVRGTLCCFYCQRSELRSLPGKKCLPLQPALRLSSDGFIVGVDYWIGHQETLEHVWQTYGDPIAHGVCGCRTLGRHGDVESRI